VTSRLSLTAEARFVGSTPARVIVFVPRGKGNSNLETVGVEVYERGDDWVDLRAVMSDLAAFGLRRVMVEGGGTLNFELLRLGLVDEVQLYLAPMVFGGASSPTLADGDGLARAAAIGLAKPEVEAWPDGGVVLRYMVERS
jgi:2,5-diamino-6-(ribosylamino)-4(3H)-pyrimidinone 5'-phosphate reductase